MSVQDREVTTAAMPCGSAEARALFRKAVLLLKEEHQVRDSAAYAILVRIAVDSGVSVREAAAAVIKTSDVAFSTH